MEPKLGDLVVIKWQDPTLESNIAIADLKEVNICHTTTVGQVVYLDDDTIIISTERVWNDVAEDSSVHIFPRRIIEKTIVILRKKEYMERLGKLIVFEGGEISV